jgi:hypothetical protein
MALEIAVELGAHEFVDNVDGYREQHGTSAIPARCLSNTTVSWQASPSHDIISAPKSAPPQTNPFIKDL